MLAGEIGLVALGAFYAFAGSVAARAALRARFLDVAMAAIAGERPPRIDTYRTLWLLVSALNVAAGGMALFVRSDWALPLFLLGLLGQVLYLAVLAPRVFDPAEAPVASGRRQTVNAAVIYALATALVVWAYSAGLLKGRDDVDPLAGSIALGLFVLMSGYVAAAFARL